MAKSLKSPRKKPRLSRRRASPPPAQYHSHRDRQIGELELQLTQHKMQEEELRRAQGELEGLSNYYSTLFNSAPIGYVVLDGAGIIREINQAAAALLRGVEDRGVEDRGVEDRGVEDRGVGHRRDLLGESLSRFVPKTELSKFLNHFRLSKSTYKQVATEMALRTQDGTIVPVELISTSFRPQAHSAQYRTAIIDISERRRAEQALRESQKHHRQLVDSIEGIVWESGPDARHFTFVSRQAERILGYPVDRWMRGENFLQNLIHPEDRERVRISREQAVEGLRNYVIEFRVFTAERRLMWLRNSVSVAVDERNRVKLQGVMMNITELKEAEEALREETRMLEVLNHTGMELAGELDLTRLVQVVTDAGKEITGAKFGAFSYKQQNDHDGHFSLHTTAGAPRDVFERLPLPPHRPLAPPAEIEKEVLRIDDVLHDKRAPKPLVRAAARHHEPEVRSYLAIPVVSHSGEVLGGLLFGHPAPGIFTERSQRLLAGIAAQAAVALDNARLYTAVRKSESHFRQLADAMPQIVWTTTAEGRINYVNRRWYEFTGFHDSQPINDSAYFQFMLEKDRQRCNDDWRNAIELGQSFQGEGRLLEQKSGSYRWHLIRAVPIHDEQGCVVSWYGTSTDIDDQKRAAEQVRELNTALERRVSERTAQLEASNKELEAFSYSVSHDLRAPLRSIDAFSQLVIEDHADKLDEEGKQYLNIVSESSHQMGRLIDDMLHLSRVTRTEMTRRPVDVSALARQVTAGLQQMEPKRKVEFVIAPDMKAEGDERLLRIALENLLNNAWKFTVKQSRARIEVGQEVREGNPVFYVRDNGAGFDMTYANKLFGAFQRLHSSTEFPGHGIGLATVQRIISRHGGRIWADAAVDKGASFYFTLSRDAAN